MNHNILHKIIDKVAFNKWKTNLQKMNNIYKKVVIFVESEYIALTGCLDCGTVNHDVYDCFIFFPNHTYNTKTIHQIRYDYCCGCGEKKHLWYQKKIDV